MRGAPRLSFITAGAETQALVAGLCAACFDPALGEAWSPQDIAAIMRDPSVVARLCCLPGPAAEQPEPIGFSLGRRILDEAELFLIGVIPERRRQGLGVELLSDYIRFCTDHEVKRIFLEVRESNAAALALYRRAGFSVIGKRPGYYVFLDGRREDALHMQYKPHR